MANRAILGAAVLSLSVAAQAGEWHLNPPERYVDCAERVIASGRLSFQALPAAVIRIACEADEVWGCLFDDLGIALIDAGAPSYLVPLIQLHEAAHFCGWPAGHPGGRWDVAT